MTKFEEVRKLLTFNATIAIFLIVFLELLFEVYSPNKASEVALAYSFIIASYLCSYAFLRCGKNIIENSPWRIGFLEFTLNINVLVIGIFMLLMIGFETISKWPVLLQKVIILGTNTLLVWFGIIFPISILLITGSLALSGVKHFAKKKNRKKEFVLRETIKNQIKKEKNIHLREREEARLRHHNTALLAFLIGGNIFLTFKQIYGVFWSGIILIIVSLLYVFVEAYIRKHEEITDNLIRAKD